MGGEKREASRWEKLRVVEGNEGRGSKEAFVFVMKNSASRRGRP